MHIISHKSRLLKEADKTGVTLYGERVPPKECIKSRGMWIDHRLSFKIHAAAVNATTRQAAGFLWRITKRRRVTPGAIHHLAITTTIPAMLWGSEAWWMGALHVLTCIQPAYHAIARIITRLPRWTPIQTLLH